MSKVINITKKLSRHEYRNLVVTSCWMYTNLLKKWTIFSNISTKFYIMNL